MINKPVDGICELKPRSSHRFCGDIDRLRKEELKRRRLLRLEQVRQQSKDIASDIRRKVRIDKNALEDEIHKRNQVFASRWKEQKLAALQNELTETLTKVGSGHKQAESEAKKQKALQHLRDLHLEAADQRGREAILRLRLDEAARKRVEEAKKLQQQHVRLMEEARSAVLVSLPLPESTVPLKKPVPVPKTSAPTSKKAKCGNDQNVSQWPSKPWPLSVPLGVTASTSGSCGKSSSVLERGEASVKSSDKPGSENSKDGFVPATSTRNDLLIYPSADSSRRPSSKSSSFGAKGSSSAATTSSVSKQSKEVPAVQLYDYTNGSHVHYVKPPILTESIPAGLVDGAEAAEACAADAKNKSSQSRDILARRHGRGKVALTRVQARREHRELLSDLAGLVRQQASLRSFLPSRIEEPQKLQVKLNEAVMDLLRPSSSTIILDGPVAPIGESQQRQSETLDSTTPPQDDHVDFATTMTPNGEALFHERRNDEITTQVDRMEEIAENVTQRASSTKEARVGELEAVALDADSEATVALSTSEAPKLNLALWTSRSPGDTSTDLSEKTLTPSGNETEADALIGEKSPIDTAEEGRRGGASLTGTNKEQHQGSGDYLSPTAEMRNPAERSEKQEKPPLNFSESKVPETSEVASKPLRVSRPPETETETETETESREQRQASTESERSLRREKAPRKNKKDSPSWSESTSYMSLPNKFLSALTEDIRSLLNLTLRRKATDARSQHNPLLAHFINRLLDMSPESVEELNVIASEVSTPPSTIFRQNSSKRSSSLDISDKLSSDVGRQSCISTSSKTLDSGSYIENEALVNVMRQCHARITSLSQMIEDVRREDFTSTPTGDRRPPSHLDSTAYYSPPPNVIAPQAPQVVPQTSANDVLNETYSAVVSRLISEIRQQLLKEAEKPVKISLDHPAASSDKTNSSSANDLSTIPELDSSPLDWPSLHLRSDGSASGSSLGSAEDVEKEFRRMGLGWAGATLRKTKEARTLDSNSSSDLLELSALFYGSYSHSTPIKTFDDKISLSLGS